MSQHWPFSFLALAGAFFMQGPAWAIGNPKLYVYKGAGCTGRDKVKEFSDFVGRRPDGMVDFLNQNSWPEMQSSAVWISDCWNRKTGLPIMFSIPMLPKSVGTLAEGARGAYDEQFRQIARSLIKGGHGGASLRIGWEFNGDWYPWKISSDPPAFRAYFRRIVAVIRSVPGAKFKIVWNPSAGTGRVKPDDAYPGDDVVDMVGLDVYNQSWSVLGGSASQRWNEILYQNYGLNWLRTFARAHQKPIVIPEWGTGKRQDGHGHGDDPLFIHNMARWMRENKVAMHGYWDYAAHDYNAQLSNRQFPKAADAFLEEFGKRN
jgi:hypothetical protein